MGQAFKDRSWELFIICSVLTFAVFSFRTIVTNDVPDSCLQGDSTVFNFVQILSVPLFLMGLAGVLIRQSSTDDLVAKVAGLLVLIAWVIIMPLYGYLSFGVIGSEGLLETKADYIYFAIVTLTTLGYGDMHPCPSARSMAAAQALTGVLLVPMLVGWAFATATRKYDA